MRRFACLSLPLLLAGVPVVHAATFNVGSASDSADAQVGDGKCLSKAGGCTLRAAVEEANASGFATTILLPPGTYILRSPDEGANFGASGPLLLSGETTITGTGEAQTIIDGGGKYRLFEIGNHANVKLSYLTLTGASVQGGDGAAVLNRGNVQISNVIFERNRAIADPLVSQSGRGAALFNTNGGTASLASIVAVGNLADGPGGAIYNDRFSTVKLLNSTIMGNQSLADSGGGISNHGNLELTISIVRGNRALGSGGGIDNVAGAVKLFDVEVSGNQAGADGGGIRTSGGLTAVNITISGNQAAGKAGGLLSRGNGQATLNNVTIADNQGGGVANEAGATLVVANTIIAENTASGAGVDCIGSLTSAGFNLIQDRAGCTIAGNTRGDVYGAAAKLGKLAANDGPNQTQALLAGSAAIDAGNPATPKGTGGACAQADQRGVARPQAGAGDVARCDIGAFEKK